MRRRRLWSILILPLLVFALVFLAAPFAMAADTTPAPAASGFTLLQDNVLLGQLAVVMILILLDWVVSVAAAIKIGKFDWGATPRFLCSNVVPYVLIWGALAGVGWAVNFLGLPALGLAPILVFIEAAYAIVFFRLGASILGTFKDLGLSPPAST